MDGLHGNQNCICSCISCSNLLFSDSKIDVNFECVTENQNNNVCICTSCSEMWLFESNNVDSATNLSNLNDAYGSACTHDKNIEIID